MRCPRRARQAQPATSGDAVSEQQPLNVPATDFQPAPAPPSSSLQQAISEEVHMESDNEDEFHSQDAGPCPCDPETDISSQQQPLEEDTTPSAAGTAAAAANANQLLQNGSFDKAVTAFSTALKGCTDKESRGKLLLGRSAAYCGLSKHLRSIPAALSEVRALYAPDPEHLAASALRDAENALRLESAHIGAVHASRGDAMFLLERYADAKEAYRLALQHAPTQCQYACKLRECEEALGNVSVAGGGDAESGSLGFNPCLAIKAQAMQDSECILCMKLLYEPVTTPCGHTFCRCCFARSADHTNKCPMCRTVLHVGRELPVTVMLKNLLENTFPKEYNERRQEAAEYHAAAGAAATATQGLAETVLPLFVMSPVLPGECMALNIFEPRYRLMVRRVMEGGRRFGMATVDNSHNLNHVACEVEITECEPLPDGRYYLEVVGRRRFTPENPREQDGYRVATAKFIKDAVPVADSQEVLDLEHICVEVEILAQRLFERMEALGRSRRNAAELLRRVGEKPPITEKEKLSFWVANLVTPLVDSGAIKMQMMTTKSTLQRMRLCKVVLDQLQDAQVNGCSIM